MRVTVDKMVIGGSCLSEIPTSDGGKKKAFVSGAIPGETVEAEITEEKKDYALLKTVSVFKPSTHRVNPFCMHYGVCGGCNMQHIDIEYQRKLKASMLCDAFLREGIKTPEINIVSGIDKGYRARVLLHDGGFLARKSNKTIPIDFCPCATDEINSYLKEMPFSDRPSGKIRLFGDKRIVTENECLASSKKIIIARCPSEETGDFRSYKTKYKKGYKKAKARYEGTVSGSSTEGKICLLGKTITFDTLGFFQSNLDLLEKSLPLITGGLSGENALDLYSGSGLFSSFLSDSFKNVCLVEHNKGSVVFAEKNLNGSKHVSYGVSGSVWTKFHADKIVKEKGPFDVVVVDPPRTGIEKEALEWLCKSDTQSIRSLSCDAATHARDAKYLLESGYKLLSLYLLDFFPQTSHIESLAYFEKLL